MNDLLQVTVEREKWYRGKGAHGSYLVIPEIEGSTDAGKMCCLGFAGKAAGLTVEEMVGITTPGRIKDGVPTSLHALVEYGGDDSRFALRLMDLNDDHEMDDSARQAAITEVGVEAGIAFTFVD